jgi:LAS superfamily LD-carboxypeptidase LdcB
MKSLKPNTVNGKLSAQLLGLTDEHIHYFDQNKPQTPSKNAQVKTLGIHHQMLTDFNALVKNAKHADLDIRIASGYRSFERQLHIWNNKFSGKTAIKSINGETVDISKLSAVDIVEAILLFSALPGASRHHWGCDIDIYAPNLLLGEPLALEPWEYANTGPMAKLTLWLVENASKYGFYFPYDRFRGGVAAEPWHLSYIPIAKQYQSALNVNLLKSLIIETDIAGKDVIISHLPTIFDRYINNVKAIDALTN